MQSVWLSKNDYERRVRAVSTRRILLSNVPAHSHRYQLLSSVLEIQALWAAIKFTGTYTDAKEHASNFQRYKQTTKRQWVTEKQDVSTLFGNVQTKLRTYGLREYTPPAGLSLAVSSTPVLTRHTELTGTERRRIWTRHGKHCCLRKRGVQGP